MAKLHRDVEIQIDDASGHARTFHNFDEAAGFALSLAVSGRTVEMDVLIYSAAGARAWGGEDAVEEYREDPEASVFERIEITANSLGRIP